MTVLLYYNRKEYVLFSSIGWLKCSLPFLISWKFSSTFKQTIKPVTLILMVKCLVQQCLLLLKEHNYRLFHL